MKYTTPAATYDPANIAAAMAALLSPKPTRLLTSSEPELWFARDLIRELQARNMLPKQV